MSAESSPASTGPDEVTGSARSARSNPVAAESVAPESDEPRRPGRPRDPQADEAILDAAMKVLAEQGFSGFTVEAVALQAGVGKATIYRRWATREELVQHVAAHFMRPVAVPDTGSLRTDLIEWYWGRYRAKAVRRDNRLMGQVLVEASVNPDMHRLMGQFSQQRRKTLAQIVERAVARGEVDDSVDGDLLLDLLSGAVLYRSLFKDEALTQQRVSDMVDLVLRGAQNP